MFITVEGIHYNANKIISIDTKDSYMHINLYGVARKVTIKSTEKEMNDVIGSWRAALSSSVLTIHDEILKQNYYINTDYVVKANEAKDKNGVNRFYILTSDSENTGYAVSESEAKRIHYDLERS